ncbi:MAG: serine/threonine protein kinase [Thermoanaerobaculia bacterium]|nr:serine/threonine protein kinase [Thermoanaerobaculia bacterium]
METDHEQDLFPESSALLHTGSIFRSRYEIVEQLGRGGYAEVYRAKDLEIHREVALKILRPDRTNASSVRRLKREAAVARDMESPYLVRVFEVETSTRPPFLTMELVRGRSLREELNAGPISLDRILEVSRQVLLGLDALHGMGILHRDIKPSNVMITEDGAVKLADFGMVYQRTRESTRITESSAIVGTLDYVAPEAVLGETIDVRTDLYSFGLVLFEMLSGVLPYGDSSSALGSALERIHRSPPSVRSLRPETARWLEGVVARLLERHPADRFASASDVLAALEAHSAPRSRRVIRRNAMVAAGILLAGAITIRLATAPSRNATHSLSHITTEGPEPGLYGYSKNGETLWHRPDLQSPFWVAANLSPGGGPQPVGFRWQEGPMEKQSLHELVILDPQTGSEAETVTLPSGGDQFQGFADRFTPELYPLDIDGDGGDEVVVTYIHTYWPSYTVVYEPRWRRARLALVAAGHHRPIGVADVDDDGANELLFLGVSNRMGWYAGLAAVMLEPPINSTTSGSNPLHTAWTPDGFLARRWHGMAWYALGPQGIWCSGIEACSTVDSELREIRIERPGIGQVRFSFDGFLVDDPIPDMTPEERNRRRGRAYRHLEEASRLWEADLEDRGETEARLAVEIAGEIGDRFLEDWARRNLGRIVIGRGRIEEGEEIFEDLSLISEAPTSAAFEAAVALHLAGRPDRSIRWYQRALGADRAWGPGRSRDRSVRALLLAYGEIGDYEGSLRALNRFSTRHDGSSQSDIFLRPYVAWRSGAEEVGIPPINDFAPDLDQYWFLETTLLQDPNLESLLERARLQIERSSDELPLLLSIAGEIVTRLGRNEEALELLAASYEGARAELTISIAVRAHFDLIVERYAKALQEAGLVEKSTEVAAVGKAWEKHRHELRELISGRD